VLFLQLELQMKPIVSQALIVIVRLGGHQDSRRRRARAKLAQVLCRYATVCSGTRLSIFKTPWRFTFAGVVELNLLTSCAE
jgi:hypothetical protein